jgi:type VI secretion system secreted protein VgrG
MKKIEYLIIPLVMVMVLLATSLSAAVSANTVAPGSARSAVPAVATAPSLGTASSFAVLAGSTATNTGDTTINGDLGVSPGTAITGFPPGIVTGATHLADAVALQAQNDVTTAYNALAGQACDTDLTDQDLGGRTLTPGVYCFSSSAQLTGALTLDAVGDPGAVFVFQIGSTLTTASNASVVMTNGANQCNVYWQVGSSATLGTDTAFAGSILAGASITLNTGADVIGRVLAREGAVTMDNNVISYDLCSSAAITPTAEAPTAVATDVVSPTATSAPTSAPVATEAPTTTPLSPTAEAVQALLPAAGVAGAAGGNLGGVIAGAAAGLSAVAIWLSRKNQR